MKTFVTHTTCYLYSASARHGSIESQPKDFEHDGVTDTQVPPNAPIYYSNAGARWVPGGRCRIVVAKLWSLLPPPGTCITISSLGSGATKRVYCSVFKKFPRLGIKMYLYSARSIFFTQWAFPNDQLLFCSEGRQRMRIRYQVLQGPCIVGNAIDLCVCVCVAPAREYISVEPIHFLWLMIIWRREC